MFIYKFNWKLFSIFCSSDFRILDCRYNGIRLKSWAHQHSHYIHCNSKWLCENVWKLMQLLFVFCAWIVWDKIMHNKMAKWYMNYSWWIQIYAMHCAGASNANFNPTHTHTLSSKENQFGYVSFTIQSVDLCAPINMFSTIIQSLKYITISHRFLSTVLLIAS